MLSFLSSLIITSLLFEHSGNQELLQQASPTLPIYIFIDALGELQGQLQSIILLLKNVGRKQKKKIKYRPYRISPEWNNTLVYLLPPLGAITLLDAFSTDHTFRIVLMK
jgi:hypothetical protein